LVWFFYSSSGTDPYPYNYLFFTILAGKIDKCSDSKTCHKDAICQNTDDSFECNCRPGFSGDGQSCKGTELKLEKSGNHFFGFLKNF